MRKTCPKCNTTNVTFPDNISQCTNCGDYLIGEKQGIDILRVIVVTLGILGVFPLVVIGTRTGDGPYMGFLALFLGLFNAAHLVGGYDEFGKPYAFGQIGIALVLGFLIGLQNGDYLGTFGVIVLIQTMLGLIAVKIISENEGSEPGGARGVGPPPPPDHTGGGDGGGGFLGGLFGGGDGGGDGGGGGGGAGGGGGGGM